MALRSAAVALAANAKSLWSPWVARFGYPRGKGTALGHLIAPECVTGCNPEAPRAKRRVQDWSPTQEPSSLPTRRTGFGEMTTASGQDADRLMAVHPALQLPCDNWTSCRIPGQSRDFLFPPHESFAALPSSDIRS